MISEAQMQALAACAISFALGRLAGKVPAAALALALFEKGWRVLFTKTSDLV